MKELDIETKIALIKMTYDGNGKLVKFTDRVYGFYKGNNTVNFIRLSDMRVVGQDYTIVYILDNVIVAFTSNGTDLSDIRSYILDIDTFEVKVASRYRLELVNNIIYEGNNVAMYHHGDKQLLRKIYDTNGNCLGGIGAYSNISAEYIEDTDYYIFKHTQIGEVTEEVTIVKITDKVEVLWSSNEYDVRCIGYGLCSFSKYHNYEDTKIYNFINKELVEA